MITSLPISMGSVSSIVENFMSFQYQQCTERWLISSFTDTIQPTFYQLCEHGVRVVFAHLFDLVFSRFLDRMDFLKVPRFFSYCRGHDHNEFIIFAISGRYHLHGIKAFFLQVTCFVRLRLGLFALLFPLTRFEWFGLCFERNRRPFSRSLSNNFADRNEYDRKC